MVKVVRLINFRKGLATNSSSTHSVIYRNKGELMEDLNIFELDYYDRCDRTIAASKSAKIKYILANIHGCVEIVDLLVRDYPEIKTYYPLIRKNIKSGWEDKGLGCYGRKSLTSDNIYFSYKYLRDLIEDDDKIIVGGSDEEEFIYDICEGHIELDTPGDIMYGEKVYKNGNYYIGFGYSRTEMGVFSKYTSGRIRFTFEKEEPTPEYPELIDLKITNKCSHGCKMCFEGSQPKGEEADIVFLAGLIVRLSHTGRKEYSIGGGNVLEYSELPKLLKTIRLNNGIACLTINAADVKRICEDDGLIDLFKEYVNGVGISILKDTDIEAVKVFSEKFKGKVYVCSHIIPEYIGMELTEKVLKELNNIPVLLLGYKSIGRGKDQPWNILTKEDIKKIHEIAEYPSIISVDTLFSRRYYEYLEEYYYLKKTVSQNEGEFSMYIDGVNKTAYKSSYELEKPYKITSLYKISEIFGNIREDSGFERFKNTNFYDK